MATNAKMARTGSLENPENSELEAMSAKIRKLEAALKTKTEELLAKEKELMSKDEELQMFKKDQTDHDDAQENEIVDIFLVFMNNNGLKRIADKILSFLDSKSFNRCRLVSRSWKDFIDNEWSMLQLQIAHLKRQPGLDDYGKPCSRPRLLNQIGGLNFGPLIKIMEETKNKSELRVFIKMSRELVSRLCCRQLAMEPLYYMVRHHRHEELKLLLHCQPKNCLHFTGLFKFACQDGCEICVKLILDRSEEKEIELNQMEKHYDDSLASRAIHEYDHCLFAAYFNEDFKKEVVDLLLRTAEEKGIDLHVKSLYPDYALTLRDTIIDDFKDDIVGAEIEEYTKETYKILKIDPLVDLKRDQ